MGEYYIDIYMYTYVYAHVYVYVYVNVYVHLRVHAYVYAHVEYVHTYMHACINIGILYTRDARLPWKHADLTTTFPLQAPVQVYLYIHVCMSMRICIYI